MNFKSNGAIVVNIVVVKVVSIYPWGGVHLWIQLLNCKSFGGETKLTYRHSNRQYFGGIFVWIDELGPKSRLFLIYQATAINQKPIAMSWCFFAFSKVYTTLRMKNRKHLRKNSRLHYIAILLKSWKVLLRTSFQLST